jgi:hypothetical protein
MTGEKMDFYEDESWETVLIFSISPEPKIMARKWTSSKCQYSIHSLNVQSQEVKKRERLGNELFDWLS